MKLSKSLVLDYCNCGIKFKYRYIDNLEPEYRSHHLTKGTELHELFYKFYDGFPEVVSNTNDIEKAGEKIKNIKYPEHIQNFIEMNITVFKALKEKGKPTKIAPLERELKMYDPELDYSGVIDAVFSDGEKVVILDYKTGRYVEKGLSKYRFELAGYSVLWNLYHPNQKATHWGIFFSENGKTWIEEVKKISVTAFLKKIKQVRQKIEYGHFPANYSYFCGNCEYFQRCRLQ